MYLDPIHQLLIDRIHELKENMISCNQIANYLNSEGVTSWTGKRFYPELVFGILRKARLKAERIVNAEVDVSCELVVRG